MNKEISNEYFHQLLKKFNDKYGTNIVYFRKEYNTIQYGDLLEYIANYRNWDDTKYFKDPVSIR